MYTIITFQCKYCGIVVKVLIKDNKKLIFSILGNNYSEKEGLTQNPYGYFKCLGCGKLDNTKRFEKVYN